jgi:hypothetical protein
VQIDAAYRLLFNDSLVGNALFVLTIDADRRYRLEAFTTPAGKISGQDGHEVLEVSSGEFAPDGIRPLAFEHSVLQAGSFTQVTLAFDRERRLLRVDNADATQTLALLPNTQDRLSYLLAAGRLAAQPAGTLHEIHLASLEATEQAVLQVIGDAEIEVPYGRFAATGIRRVSLDDEEQRELWFADAAGPLPLRVLRRNDGNAIEMQLESLTSGPLQSGSASE